MTLNFIKTFQYQEKSGIIAIVHVVLHGVSGALYQSIFWAAASKHQPKGFEGIGISLINMGNNSMNFVVPMITGKIIGETLTKESAKNCIFFQIFLSGIGIFAAGFFTFFEYRENKKLAAKGGDPNQELCDDKKVVFFLI